MARDPRKSDKGGKAGARSQSLTSPVKIPRGKSGRVKSAARAEIADQSSARPDLDGKAARAGKRGRDATGASPFAVTVELVVLTIREAALQVLLVERAEKPHKGSLALPGGFVRVDEDLVEAAYRELAERIGPARDGEPGVGHLEQLGSYGAPGRDPRTRTLSVAYLALAPRLPETVAEVAGTHWVDVAELSSLQLAFDHAQLLADGLERARSKLEYSSLATAFCGEHFTVSQLREVYEAVWGGPLDPRNFHRKATRTDGLLVPTGRYATGEAGRPAQLYRRGSVTTLNPPITRTGT